jgi:hypothetical protein
MVLDDDNSDLEIVEPVNEIPIIDDQSSHFIHETEGQIADCVESLSQMPEIQPDQWEGLDQHERLNTLQTVEDRIADIQGRPSVAIDAQQMGENEFGAWDGQSIVINVDHVNGDQSIMENLDTVIHEGRHAYQEYAMDHPEIVGDDEVISEWIDNSQNYLDLQTFGAELYYSQPLEQDAWNYASSITDSLYSEKDKGI